MKVSSRVNVDTIMSLFLKYVQKYVLGFDFLHLSTPKLNISLLTVEEVI